MLTREKEDLEDNTESLFPFFPFQDSPSFPVNPSSTSFFPPIYKNWFTVYTFIFLFMLPHYFCLYSPLLFTSITDSKTNNLLVSPSFPSQFLSLSCIFSLHLEYRIRKLFKTMVPSANLGTNKTIYLEICYCLSQTESDLFV